jgi:hypothetical protein
VKEEKAKRNKDTDRWKAFELRSQPIRAVCVRREKEIPTISRADREEWDFLGMLLLQKIA